MKHAVISWVAMGLAFFVGGPVVSAAYNMARSGTGVDGMNAMFAEPVWMGIAALILAVAVACAIGVVCSRVSGIRSGYRCAGFALVWAAFDGGRMGDLLREHASPYMGVAIEALIAGIVVLIGGVLMTRAARSRDDQVGEQGEAVEAGLSVLIVVVVGLLVSGAIARTEVFGQCIAATILAAVAGTLVARLKFPSVPLVACLGGCVVLAVVLPLVAAGIEGGDGLRDLYLGRFLAVARPMPLDWMAGCLIGVPMGASWAASMVERQPVGGSAGGIAASGGSEG